MKNDNPLKILIVGCGQVGRNLAEQLVEQGNNVTVIDTSANLVNEISAVYDCIGIVGNGATHEVQREAGIKDTDLLIAVTGSDELNILCCLVAKRESNCHTIARVKNPDYSKDTEYLQNTLGIGMVINPQFAAASEIARILRFPSAMKIDTFASGKVELVKFRLPESSPLVGMTVKDVVMKLKCDILICTVERGDEAYIANGNFEFKGKDIISLVASPKNAEKFFSKIGYKTNAVKDVILAGGGDTGTYLCEMLLKDGISVKIIEKKETVCDELCAEFPSVTVIHGNAGDKETLMEEDIDSAGAFVALTNLDEENILISLFAKNIGCKKVITKINRFDYDDVIKHLDLDSIIYPKNITSALIVRYTRAMKNTIGSNIETLYNVIKGKVEATEFIVKENSPITAGPLMTLKFKEGVLVAAILRDDKVLIPRGSDAIAAGDRVVIVSSLMDINDISDVVR